MSATALRPSSGAAPPPRPAPVPVAAAAPPDEPGAGALWLRLATCTALAVFGAQAWGDMVRPEDPARVVGAAGVGAWLGAFALLSPGLTRAARGAILAAVGAGAVAATLLLAGVPLRLLDPEFWGELASGLGQGISALPGLSVPYRGVDEWNRIAMLLGGTALAVGGPLVAAWPARDGRRTSPVVPAVVLSVLYAVPAVQLRSDHPFLEGTAFALLLAAVLFGERLRRRDTPVAVVAVAVAALAGLALAPRLDRPDPWIDYESIAQSLGERGTTTFRWDHQYGPLDWARDGREVLRVRAPSASYWKATTLADFDGLRWREVRPRGLEDDPEANQPNPKWVQDLRVRVRNLRTRQFVSAGTTLRIDRSPRTPRDGAPGSFVTADRPLRRGHAYFARAYIPRPSAAQLDAASADYPTTIAPYLSMQLPPRVGGPPGINPETMLPDPGAQPAYVVFADYSAEDQRPIGVRGAGYGDREGTSQWLAESSYARAYRLARRLRADSRGPYDYVRSVLSHLRKGYVYTETPPRRPVPLDAFIFDDRRGYCQQFSGAMALLLRMGGVPARVATGFTPGTLDRDRREYVVRDLDAHSWVEAYFPSYGWVTFDPTPAVAPPRSQAAGVETRVEDDEDTEEAAPSSERRSDPTVLQGAEAEVESSGPPVLLLVGGGALLLLAGGALVLVLRARRRFARLSPDERVAELERALRRSGRSPAPGLTLRRLEEGLSGAPDAAAYVRALRIGRYGGNGVSPTREQRRALRRELGAGLGVRGRARSVWALPPW